MIEKIKNPRRIFRGNKNGKFGNKSHHWKGGKVKINCILKTCRKEKFVFPNQIKIGKGKFCSQKCSQLYIYKK